MNIDREVYLHLLSSFSLRLIQQTVPSCFGVWFAQISGLSLLFSPRGPNKHKTKSTFLFSYCSLSGVVLRAKGSLPTVLSHFPTSELFLRLRRKKKDIEYPSHFYLFPEIEANKGTRNCTYIKRSASRSIKGK